MNLSNAIGYLLAIILIILLLYFIQRQIQEYKLQDDPMLYTLKNVLKPLLEHYGISNIKLYKGDKSFTINKEKVFLCLYDENNEYYPIHMLIYVTLHEIAHHLNKDDVGHTEKFHHKFEEVLTKATELGIYNPRIPIIKNYCGTN
jgi:hypothetical protein